MQFGHRASSLREPFEGRLFAARGLGPTSPRQFPAGTTNAPSGAGRGWGPGGGRKPEPVNPLAKRVAELEREKRRLERKLEQAELLLDIQKKASRLLEIPLRSQADDGSA